MGKKLLHMALAVIAAVLPTIPSMAQIPEGYYNSLKGKKGAELKTAVYKRQGALLRKRKWTYLVGILADRPR